MEMVCHICVTLTMKLSSQLRNSGKSVNGVKQWLNTPIYIKVKITLKWPSLLFRILYKSKWR